MSTGTTRFDWSSEKGIYHDKGFAFCGSSRTTLGNNSNEVGFYVEPATPGCLTCCMFCATPLILFSPCMLPFIICNTVAKALVFRKDLESDRIEFTYTEKHFCSGKPPMKLTGARAIRVTSEMRTHVTQDEDTTRVSTSTVYFFVIAHDGGEYHLPEIGQIDGADARNFCNEANRLMGTVLVQPMAPTAHTVTVDAQGQYPTGQGMILAAAPPTHAVVPGTYQYTAGTQQTYPVQQNPMYPNQNQHPHPVAPPAAIPEAHAQPVVIYQQGYVPPQGQPIQQDLPPSYDSVVRNQQDTASEHMKR